MRIDSNYISHRLHMFHYLQLPSYPPQHPHPPPPSPTPRHTIQAATPALHDEAPNHRNCSPSWTRSRDDQLRHAVVFWRQSCHWWSIQHWHWFRDQPPAPPSPAPVCVLCPSLHLLVAVRLAGELALSSKCPSPATLRASAISYRTPLFGWVFRVRCASRLRRGVWGWRYRVVGWEWLDRSGRGWVGLGWVGLDWVWTGDRCGCWGVGG